MENKGAKRRFLSKTAFGIIGVVLLLLSAVVLLWYGNSKSTQALPPMIAQIRFDGEYRIDGGSWQKIKKGEHISATKGDVTLRGKFYMIAPDGTVERIPSNEEFPIALFVNHVNLTVTEKGGEPFAVEMEDPLYGVSACGESWYAYPLTCGSEGTVEMVIRNPHRFGNESAIDELLSGLAFWNGIEFEKSTLETGEGQRDIGSLFLIVSLVVLGIALFSTLIHIKNSEIIWVIGALILFAGAYLSYSADGVSIWSESVVTNTTLLGCSMMLYMLFLSMAMVFLLKVTKRVGAISVAVLGIADGAMLIIPMLSDLRFYDTWLFWAVAQIIVNAVLFVCIIKEFLTEKTNERWFYLGMLLPLMSFVVDVVMTWLGVWKGGLSSEYVFIIIFIAAMIAVLKVIPQSINALTKTKELETEKRLLNAKLAESRVSTMMSQIRPHFIYNTLGSIEQLCIIDPPKAGELVHNFARYLRGNFGELDNPKPILVSQEMEHVHYYVSIENVRFPDMTFTCEMNSADFRIPALTVQPIVENAIKHGLMKLPKGGHIKVVTFETETDYCVSVEDDGMGFDTDVLYGERTHVGIRNIRGRLKAMVNGTLEIESTVGVGTRVLITIPKEVK